MGAGPGNQQDGLRYNCVCAKYNFRCLHLISSTTWYHHLQEVNSDKEQQCMLIAKSQLHPPTNSPTDGRSRGAVGHRCKNVLPTQKQGQETEGSHWDFADPEPHMHKRGRQQDRLEQSTDQHRPRPDINIDELECSATFWPMSDTLSFIQALRNASTTDPVAKLSDKGLDRLHNPPTTPLVIDNPSVQLSISMYLAHEHSSQASYKHVCRLCKLNFAGAPGADEILSYHNVEKLIRIHTGVEALLHDMCCNTCHAFTGPYSTLDECYICQTSRWNEKKLQGRNRCVKVPAQQFTTILLVLDELRELNGAIPIVDDVVMGWDYLGTVLDSDIKKHHNIVLMVSLDGAQLYESKESDCWMYVWVILNLSPQKWYHKLHVLPGGFIPGPNKLKNLNSFLFPGFHHLAALQHEGLPMWDPLTDLRYISGLYLVFTTANGPVLVYWDGMVRHSGKNGCRLYCGVQGRHKENGTDYYPALLCLCDHIVAVPQGGSTEYTNNLKKIWDKMKTETGLTKPPLILGLYPTHSLDVMHLTKNLSDLLLSLWHGTLSSTWDWAVHGAHLPGSYDCKLHNIAKKLNTQYKTWEFQLYTFGITSILLYSVLPSKYWANYCMLHSLTQQQIQDAHGLLCGWEHDFEQFCYQLKHDCIHFIHPAVHQKGPPICHVQWTMEQIRQPSKPYANLACEGVWRCQVNALISTLPEFDDSAKDLGNGYTLLHKHLKYSILPDAQVTQAIRNYLPVGEELPHITKWARLLLPNGQITHSVWREALKSPHQLRVSRNVKFTLDDKVCVGEVQYFTQLATQLHPEQQGDWTFYNVTIMKLYSEPDTELLKLSSQVLTTSTLLNQIIVCDVKAI
ncbi:hypothetical protein BDN67DRAFT_992757 [Paxillus ammoniavirescens]|nr:hypothetical protein BDN67DRAFT_992757 [Paxillus ammoniavirescens]